MDVDGNVIVDLSLDMIVMNFGIPVREKVLVTIEEHVVSLFIKNTSNYKRHINEVWTSEPRKIDFKATDIMRADFQEPQRDLIIMLSRAFGKVYCRHFHTWVFHYMTIVLIGKDYFDWPHIISDNNHNQLTTVHQTKKFFMTSYVIWVVA